MRSLSLLLASTGALAADLEFHTSHFYHGDSCGSIANEAFADMHDGDVKNVTITESGQLKFSQTTPVAWEVTSELDLTTCTATVDFSKTTKPDKPPVPLKVAIKQTTVGTLLIEWTDPSGTLNKDTDYPLNLWTTEDPLPAADACATFSSVSFQDMHDGDVKIVSAADGKLHLGQKGIWNLTTSLDPKTCMAVVDFSKTDKPAKPPVPLTVAVAVASGNDGRQSVIMTWTDPTKTISPSAKFPLNMWEQVTDRGAYEHRPVIHEPHMHHSTPIPLHKHLNEHEKARSPRE